ncbi:hypothetical protein BH09PAT4_BH09PAT4_05460 [soil metagenome]
MISKQDIYDYFEDNKSTIEGLGFLINGNGRKISYGNYSVEIITSKYGYDDEFRLNFFIRAEKKDVARDSLGNALDPFEEGSLLDLQPQTLNKYENTGKDWLASLYKDDKKLLGVEQYFSAPDKATLGHLLEHLLSLLANVLKV